MSKMHTQAEGEISLLDTLLFLKKTYKTILLFVVFGLLSAVLYISVTPKIYEASAQIYMAQIGNASANPNFSGTNIEEPQALISRLSTPSSFPDQVIQGCNSPGKSANGLQITNLVKFSLPKGVANIVELKTTGTSPKIAIACANAIFDLIEKTQAQLLAPYIEEIKIKLADDEIRLQKAKELMGKSDKLGQTASAIYLSTRDEIRYLLDEIATLKNILSPKSNRTTRLVAPIYVSDKPISPNKRIVLLVGLIGGLCLGVLIPLVCKIMLKITAQLQGEL
jgi:capsular polysaccharide biosynthesis protein